MGKPSVPPNTSPNRSLLIEIVGVSCLAAFVAVLCWTMVYWVRHNSIEQAGDEMVKLMQATKYLAWLLVPATGLQLRHYLPKRS